MLAEILAVGMEALCEIPTAGWSDERYPHMPEADEVVHRAPHPGRVVDVDTHRKRRSRLAAEPDDPAFQLLSVFNKESVADTWRPHEQYTTSAISLKKCREPPHVRFSPRLSKQEVIAAFCKHVIQMADHLSGEYHRRVGDDYANELAARALGPLPLFKKLRGVATRSARGSAREALADSLRGISHVGAGDGICWVELPVSEVA